MANEAIDVIITKKARQELVETREEVARVDAEFIKLANHIEALTGKRTIPTLPKEYEKRLKESSQWTSQLNANNKESARLAKALATQKAKLSKLETANAKALQKERLETQILNKALKDEAVLSSKLTSEYQKLTVRRNRAALAIKNEISLNGENSKGLKKLRAEFEKLDKRYVSANRGAKDFRDNVGNYKSALGGATGALRSFAGAFGVYSGLQIAGQVFNEIKAIDGMNKALKQVTETQEAYNQAKFFLSQTAEESGAEIIGLTKSYTKFLASAKTTNLTALQTQDIFEKVAKAGGVLGLSTEDVKGSFRALEQILSKGTVQAEEIRGQLGERLPGAFQILARSMNLTTQELGKQLELGKVISEDVLPGFARELEKTYSLDKIQRVETLAAAQTRLGNSWTQFIENVDSGEGIISRTLKTLLTGIQQALKGLSRLNLDREEVRIGAKVDIEEQQFNSTIKELQDRFDGDENKIKIFVDENLDAISQNLNKASNEVEFLKGRLKDVESLKIKAIEDDEDLKILKYSNEINELNGKLDDATESAAQFKGGVRAYNEFLKDTTPVTNSTEAIDENTKAVKRNITELEKLEGKKVKSKTTGFITAKQIKKEREVFEKAFEGLEIKVSDGFATGEIDGIKSQFEFFKDSTVQFGLDALEVPDTDEITAALDKIAERYKNITKEAKLSAQEQSEIFGQLFSTFAGYYNLDLEAFKSVIFDKAATEEDYANAAKSISGAVLDSKIISYENELAANQEKLDRILNDDTVSDEQKLAAQEKFDKEEKQLNLKKAKAERDSVLINIAVDTAAAVAKALGQTGILAPLVIPGIIAAGAVQAAFVASQPLPQFFKGTQNAPEGWAWTDEQGAELHTDRYGRIKDEGSEGGARLKFLESGDKIFTAPKTKDIFKKSVSETSNVSNINNYKMITAQEIENAVYRGVSKNNKPVIKERIIYKEKYSEY